MDGFRHVRFSTCSISASTSVVTFGHSKSLNGTCGRLRHVRRTGEVWKAFVVVCVESHTSRCGLVCSVAYIETSAFGMFMHSCVGHVGGRVAVLLGDRYGGAFSFFCCCCCCSSRWPRRDRYATRSIRARLGCGIVLLGGSVLGACCPIVALAPPLAAGRPPAGRAPAADRLRAWRRPGGCGGGLGRRSFVDQSRSGVDRTERIKPKRRGLPSFDLTFGAVKVSEPTFLLQYFQPLAAATCYL